MFLPLLLSLYAAAAPAETLHLSLADAVQRALRGGTQAELARSERERARIATSEAWLNLLPQADVRLQRYNQSLNLATFGFSIPGQPSVIGPFNVTDGQIAAAMQVFNLAAIRRYAAFRQGETASRYALEAADNDVAAAVARLYVLVQRADAQVASRQSDVTLFEQLSRVAADQLRAGTGTRLDVAQANVQLSRARQLVLVAQNDRENARLALLNAIGADEAEDLVLDEPLPATATAPPLETALAAAQSTRPELRELEAREKEARLILEAARARRIPAVSMDFEGDMSGNHTDDLRWTRRIGGTLSVPLFRADVQINIARAKVQLHDAEVRRAQQQRDVEQDVRRSILSMQNAAARVTVAEESVRVAEEALTVARDRQESGYGSSVEVDRAQDAYRQAHEDLITARADLAAAGNELRHATGDIRSIAGAAP
ncbi:MAG TPA: TolC family protein [Thermoanaerobaculia bacterium]|nr:TolC family protein [Thermoanaerobaculia bacterium]